METSVKQRIIKFMAYKKLSHKRFESAAGLSNGYINSLRHSPTATKLQSILEAFPDLNRVWLLTGEGEMLNSKTDIANSTLQTLPLIPVEAMAGFLSGNSNTIMDYDCEQYVVPAFKADYLIRVQGDSMVPKYESGDIIACRRVSLGGLWFQWGKTYVLDTAQGALVKRIEPSETEGCVSIHSENPKYKPFDLPVEEIYAVALVVGTIRVEG
jgi:phage repressor protein C with HTH and peptisase S24 domain